jgi:FlgD Ig-like domain
MSKRTFTGIVSLLEVTRPGGAVREAGAGVRPGVDRRRATLQRPPVVGPPIPWLPRPFTSGSRLYTHAQATAPKSLDGARGKRRWVPRACARRTWDSQARDSTSADTFVDAAITTSTGKTVRPLAAALGVGKGPHSLSWDGLTGSGTPVADGTYTFTITSTDATGAGSQAQLPLQVDTTGPLVKLATDGKLKPSKGIVLTVTDPNGVRNATLAVDGRRVATLAPTQTTIVYRDPHGWTVGKHTYAVTATDRAGNTRHTTGTFTVAGLPTVLTGRRFDPGTLHRSNQAVFRRLRASAGGESGPAGHNLVTERPTETCLSSCRSVSQR